MFSNQYMKHRSIKRIEFRDEKESHKKTQMQPGYPKSTSRHEQLKYIHHSVCHSAALQDAFEDHPFNDQDMTWCSDQKHLINVKPPPISKINTISIRCNNRRLVQTSPGTHKLNSTIATAMNVCSDKPGSLSFPKVGVSASVSSSKQHCRVSSSMKTTLLYDRIASPLLRTVNPALKRIRSLTEQQEKVSCLKRNMNMTETQVEVVRISGKKLSVPVLQDIKNPADSEDTYQCYSDEYLQDEGLYYEEDLTDLESEDVYSDGDYGDTASSITSEQAPECNNSHSNGTISCKDELFILDVHRRRERDFGKYENDFDTAVCQVPHGDDDISDAVLTTNCTPQNLKSQNLECETSLESQIGLKDVDSTAVVKKDIIRPKTNTPAVISMKVCEPTQKIHPHSLAVGQYSVPVASSLLALPGSYPTVDDSLAKASPALTISLFPNYFPPTIHFPLHNEKYTPLPKELKCLLKWKVSSITPNIVKSCFSRAGFSKCTRGEMWTGYWGKHMKAESFRIVKDYQKVNHFPGTFQIGRKDRLWRNLSRLQSRVGKKDCDFFPKTYVLPQDLSLLKKDWDDTGKRKWILKPPASARGIGIKVVNKWRDIPKNRAIIVQRYISDPYLINGMKFDLRVYVYVSSYDPLKVYIFREGLARFATCKYSTAMKHISNRFMHLTNYSINKRNSDFTPNTDETICQGHKWGLLALWRYMSMEMGVNTDKVWDAIKDVVIKTIISSEHCVSSFIKAYVKNSSSVYELFGFDIMLDHHLKPWILEVNISPSLHSNSQLDVNIKGRLVRDLFNISGYRLYNKKVLTGEITLPRNSSLTAEERIKHSFFIQRTLPKEERKKILDNLTSDDIRTIMISEDELSRCGYFERAFPCAKFDKYRKFFEYEKYYNTLLGEWASKYEKHQKKGISLLNKIGSEQKLKTYES